MCHALFGIYTKSVFITYLKFKFTQSPIFLIADLATLAEVGDSATLQQHGVLLTAWGSGQGRTEGLGSRGQNLSMQPSPQWPPPLSCPDLTGGQAIYPWGTHPPPLPPQAQSGAWT